MITDRLISTEALMKRINCYPGIRDAVAKQLRYVPTVDAEPVRHGHWKTAKTDIGELLYCSECKVYGVWTKYCPNCGAKMDEVSE